jgi:hypothetical protein
MHGARFEMHRQAGSAAMVLFGLQINAVVEMQLAQIGCGRADEAWLLPKAAVRVAISSGWPPVRLITRHV